MDTFLKSQNPWWTDHDWTRADPHLTAVEGKAYYFQRPERDRLLKVGCGINIVRGPRQVGKTTLLKELIRDLLVQGTPALQIGFLSCETIEDFKELEARIVPWISGHESGGVLILDEVCFVREWARAVLAISNRGLLRKFRVFITGSNARDLKESSERLPGRRHGGLDVRLMPLSFEEFRSLSCFALLPASELVDVYLKVGGFPHAIRDFSEHGLVLDETYRTYFNWILGDASHYGLQEAILRQFLIRIHQTVASRVTWKSLIETTTVKSHETALDYVEHLEDAFIVFVLYFWDPGKRTVVTTKARKIYFVDPLLHWISLGWASGAINMWNIACERIADPNVKGKLFENFVASEWRRRHPSTQFWYSSKTGKEIDLVVPTATGLSLFDVKLSVDATNSRQEQQLNQDVTIVTPSSFQNG
ncbi:MAG: ATP-binding protein [Deltaproteobacteria bacterium]|nr:ATP-binding protein [Deltaproteobacteria bacterium]